MPELKTYLKKTAPSLLSSAEWQHFEISMNYLLNWEIKLLKNHNPESDSSYFSYLITVVNRQENSKEASFWDQSLKSTRALFFDATFDSYFTRQTDGGKFDLDKRTKPQSQNNLLGCNQSFSLQLEINPHEKTFGSTCAWKFL